jgi:hypothetical protein
MTKTLVILILLFNGTLVEERLDFNPVITVMDCLAIGDAYREALSTYHGPGKDQGWYLNDGRGTIQGYYCE